MKHFTWPAGGSISGFQTMQDLLSLIGKQLTKTRYKQWSRYKKQEINEYISKAYYKASDNNVKVPLCPVEVKLLKDITLCDGNGGGI